MELIQFFATSIFSVALASILVALVFGFLIWRRPQAEGFAYHTSKRILDGVHIFLHLENKVVASFVVVIFLITGFLLQWEFAFSFLVGSIITALGSYLGWRLIALPMNRSIESFKSNLPEAFRFSLRAGKANSFLLSGLSLGAIALLLLIFRDPSLIIGYAFGTALVAFFAHLTGGFFSAVADRSEGHAIKKENHNIAKEIDEVGDFVGDVLGPNTDFFETFSLAILLAAIVATKSVSLEAYGWNAVWFPLAIVALQLLGNFIGFLFVRSPKKTTTPTSLSKIFLGSFLLSALLVIVSSVYFVDFFFGDFRLVIVIIIAYLATIFSFLFIEYASLPKQNKKYEADQLILLGFKNAISNGVIWILVIVAAAYAAYAFLNLYGLAILALIFAGVYQSTLLLQGFGASADVSSDIALRLPNCTVNLQANAHFLDRFGALAKGGSRSIALASAFLVTLTLLILYFQNFQNIPSFSAEIFALSDFRVLFGIGGGILISGIFGASILNKVLAGEIMLDQILSHKVSITDFNKSVEMLSKKMINNVGRLAFLILLPPIFIFFFWGPSVLSGYLVGIIGTAFLLATVLILAGLLWEHQKKNIAKENDAEKIADALGDAFKDAIGPAFNNFLKLSLLLGLVIFQLWQS